MKLFPFLIFPIFIIFTIPLVYCSETHNKGWILAHNSFRTLHQAPKLSWSQQLAESAEAWAKSCPSRHSFGTFGNYGENIFWANYPMSSEEVVEFWYKEEKKYNYDNPVFSIKTGHFSQVIWKSSLKVGCGSYDKCPGELGYIWVCHYYPPGNYRKKFDVNVLPPKSLDSTPVQDN
jgi:uncharacterized protein YkwD